MNKNIKLDTFRFFMKNIFIIGFGSIGSKIYHLLEKDPNINFYICEFDTISLENTAITPKFKSINSLKTSIIKNKKVEIISKKFQEIPENDLKYFYKASDLVLLCVDNVKTRMDANYRFYKIGVYQNPQIKMIDVGIEGYIFHFKKLDIESSCLFCIKDLYTVDNYFDNASCKTLNKKFEKKIDFLNSFKSSGKEFSNEELQNIKVLADKNNFKTTVFEIKGVLNNIIPSTCYTTTICANYLYIFIEKYINVESVDYLNFDIKSMKSNYIKMEKLKTCFVCNKFKKYSL